MSNEFWRGVVAALCVSSLGQDVMGREWVASHWLSSSISVPLALLGLLFVVVVSATGGGKVGVK